MYEQIPVEILEQYVGQWIVWDEDARRVVGWGVTLEEAEEQAQKTDPDHLLRVHHVLPLHEEIAGML